MIYVMFRPTFIHRLLIANTVEEKIMRFLQNKTETGLRYVLVVSTEIPR
jgi:hypothetical protein